MRLSFVYAVRDPDYGHGLLHRMQVSLDTLAQVARDARLDYELIVVEWNPSPDKKTVRELISWPSYAPGRLRVIEVPASVHDRFENAEVMPFFEYIAKNVGIRRSRGDWVLACSPDVLFNRKLVRFLTEGRLSGEAFYRIDRRDVVAPVPLEASWRQRLRICARNVVLINRTYGSVPPRPGLRGWLKDELEDRRPQPAIHPFHGPLHTNASDDFLLMSRENWFRLKGYAEFCTHAHIDAILCWAANTAGLRQVILGDGMKLYHQEHDRTAHQKLPQTDWRPWYEQFTAGGVMISNSEASGLADREFPEYVI